MAKKKSPKTTTSPKMAFPPFEVPKGPTGIRPLTADRLRAYEKARKAYQERSRANNRLKTPSTTPSPPVKTTSPNDMQYRHHTISPQGNSSLEPKVPKTTNTFMTVNIQPQPGVSITDQLEPAVRNVQSPCGNFSWGRRSENIGGFLRISLFHNDTSCKHVGNLARIDRLFGKPPATGDCGPPTSIEQIKDKLAIDMRDMIADVHMIISRQTELVAWSHLGVAPKQDTKLESVSPVSGEEGSQAGQEGRRSGRRRTRTRRWAGES